MIDIKDVFDITLFIVFVTVVVVSLKAEGVNIQTQAVHLEKEMSMPEYAMIIDRCLKNVAGNGEYIYDYMMSLVARRGRSLDEICSLDVLEDAAAEVKDIETKRSWKIGRGEKKSSYSLWTNILSAKMKAAESKGDFFLEEGIYEMHITKMPVMSRRDAIMLTFIKPPKGDYEDKVSQFEIQKIFSYYDEIMEGESYMTKIILLSVSSEGLSYDDITNEKYRFSAFGESFMSIRDRHPVWVQIADDVAVDMGIINVRM